MTMQETLNLLELEIDDLKKKYDLFFQGILRVEPMMEKKNLDLKVRQMGQRNIPNTTDKFRFETLRARYYSYLHMWTRVVTLIEEGKIKRDQSGKVAFHSDGPVDEDNLNNTYLEYLKAKKELNEEYEEVDFNAFKDRLIDKAHEIQGKSGCNKVTFRVVVEAGKAKLKATKK